MSPIESVSIMIFVSGLLGGFGHCIGMCGPFVAAYSMNLPRGSAFIPHLLFSLGRITTYSLLGGVIGFTGSFAGTVKYIERFQNITLAIVGAVMIMTGLAVGRWLPFLGAPHRHIASPFRPSFDYVTRAVHRFIKPIMETKGAGSFFPMGLVLGFIPCGLLYTALIAAAGAGVEAGNPMKGFLQGMLLLFLFGLGTSPALLLLGRIVSMKGAWLRNRFYKGSAVVMIIIGVVFLYRSFGK